MLGADLQLFIFLMMCRFGERQKLLTAKVAKNCRRGREERGHHGFFAFFALTSRALRLKAFGVRLRADLQLLPDLLPFGNSLPQFSTILLEFPRNAGSFFGTDKVLQRRFALCDRRFKAGNFLF
jgi:hypothetical protein